MRLLEAKREMLDMVEVLQQADEVRPTSASSSWLVQLVLFWLQSLLKCTEHALRRPYSCFFCRVV